MKLSFNYLLVGFISCAFWGCQPGKTSSDGDKVYTAANDLVNNNHKEDNPHNLTSADCDKIYTAANDHVNRYHMEKNAHDLDTAGVLLDGHLNDCRDYRVRMVNLRISVFVLAKDADRGYRFIDSLNAGEFGKTYLKQNYLSFFKAIAAIKMGDRQKRDSSFQEMVNNIWQYIGTHLSDQMALSEMFAMKAMIVDPEKVADEVISLKERMPPGNSDFLDMLSNSVRSMKYDVDLDEWK
ncbi:hypothetical protein [Chitinophaga arvensicola]|uniref:Uncharacterized protein n=1 Tax=Chitinophaga arvensicola TaxID=29529 RepID=A0A1I0S7N8_9BACT|nr:hypothetical protein [Chitinophaga arvensicola]SEW51715.1 hypothetical protein SAMN04488122_4460 [Chitinophaga arvensicola]